MEVLRLHLDGRLAHGVSALRSGTQQPQHLKSTLLVFRHNVVVEHISLQWGQCSVQAAEGRSTCSLRSDARTFSSVRGIERKCV